MHPWFLMCSFGEFNASILPAGKMNHTTLRTSCTYSSSPFSPGAGGDDNGCFPANAAVIGRMGPIRMEDVRWDWVWIGASVVQASEDAQSHNLYERRGKSWKDMHCWLSKGEFHSHVCIYIYIYWDWMLPTSSIRVGKAGRSISIVFGGEFLH